MQHIAKEGRCFLINANQFCKVSRSSAPKRKSADRESRYQTFQKTIRHLRKITMTDKVMGRPGRRTRSLVVAGLALLARSGLS